MNTNTIPSLAAIIVPCFNQREFTRSCLQSLFRYTRAPWEPIVVDNGSTDDTAAYLAGVQDATAVPVTVIANATNLGFPAAINQGLQLAQGEYLVLLNNDVVVTEGWLDQLTALTTAKTTGLTAKDAKSAKEENGERSGNGSTAETAETKTESENRHLAIIDFNEVGAGIGGSPIRGPLPSPPPGPPFTLHGEPARHVQPPGGPFTLHGDPARHVHPPGGPFAPPGDPACHVHPPVPPFTRGGLYVRIRGCCFTRRKDAAWTGSGRVDDRAGRADVQLCRAAAVGRRSAVSRPGGDARLCSALAR